MLFSVQRLPKYLNGKVVLAVRTMSANNGWIHTESSHLDVIFSNF